MEINQVTAIPARPIINNAICVINTSREKKRASLAGTAAFLVNSVSSLSGRGSLTGFEKSWATCAQLSVEAMAHMQQTKTEAVAKSHRYVEP
jgi:hypothetical protein